MGNFYHRKEWEEVELFTEVAGSVLDSKYVRQKGVVKIGQVVVQYSQDESLM